ncbi:high affinity Mn2+ porin [Actimicrobium sp. GrIS 1.19]|uniref:carbohydrate porin n=1 Tax=Actimicrobium sp. GrIS 1.19 TaxID=3071708 RepID=UPI002E031749|nr:high affinity Mn2+ porin [Actimicrobium sp. GrIS 1.19]
MHHTTHISSIYGTLVSTTQRDFGHVTQAPKQDWAGVLRRSFIALARLTLRHPGVRHIALLTLIAITLLGLTLPSMSVAADAEPVAVGKTEATPSNATIPEMQPWAVHGQVTNITQKHSHFNSPYSGANSLDPDGRMEETTDVTLFAGVRLWQGAEFWVNPEIDQGFGFNNTLGAAGFPNGGAYKLGSNAPYLRLPRAFIRQTISLGGEAQLIEPAANQLGGTRSANNLTLTAGKFAVTDIFDTNVYAHDPRADFLNWSIIDSGPFDYAADSWGYTFGGAVEWTQDWLTLRGGVFQLSEIPNGKVTGLHLNQNALIAELEMRHQMTGHPGKIKLLAFRNHGNMASYREATQLGVDTASVPDVALVRRVDSRSGFAVNLEQEIASDLGAFARVGMNGGDKEAFEFSDINNSIAAGLSIKGDRWSRHDDTVGVAFAVNRLSGSARDYFSAGGLGILVGDGALNYGSEKILEAYYTLRANSHLALTLDFQRIANPAYNRDRGPVNFVALRVHGEF